MVSSEEEAHQLLTDALQKLKQESKKSLREKKTKEKESKKTQKSEEEFIKTSVIDGTKGVMHRIEPGSFKMGEVGDQIDVNITKPFEMMATATTQVIWQRVAELITQKFPGHHDIKADPSSFKGAIRPVESVSFDDIQTWITGLNELSAAGEPQLSEIFPGHKKGDVYRLPTEAEWEFVVRGRGQYNGTYHYGDQDAQLGGHAWHSGNSGNVTHPVAEKKPLVIDGKEFYDMQGNVWEWVQDWYQSALPGGTDPQGPPTGPARVIRGGSWGNFAWDLRSAVRGSLGVSDRSGYVGFRLVRTL